MAAITRWRSHLWVVWCSVTRLDIAAVDAHWPVPGVAAWLAEVQPMTFTHVHINSKPSCVYSVELQSLGTCFDSCGWGTPYLSQCTPACVCTFTNRRPLGDMRKLRTTCRQ